MRTPRKVKRYHIGECDICGVKMVGTVSELLEHMFTHKSSTLKEIPLMTITADNPIPEQKDVIH